MRAMTLFRERMISLRHEGLAVTLAGIVALSGCGGSRHAAAGGAGAGTSIAAAEIAFVAPRDGILATAAIASNEHLTPVMNTTLVLAAPSLGVAVGVLASSYPAIRAARITPMAALRL